MITDPDPEKVRRVTEAMFTMKKLDIAALQKAYAGCLAAGGGTGARAPRRLVYRTP
jgi:hypothetical protein